MAGNVLLTGFEPFLNYSYNPSGEIAKMLDGKTIEGKRIVGKVLPVKHAEVRDILNNHIRQYKPEAIIALGLVGVRGCISLEEIAINRYYFRSAQEETDEPLYKTGPAAYFSKLPLKEIKAALQAKGIPAEYSFFPDTYVSNEVFFEVMRASEKLKIAKAGFVHLPLTYRQLIEMDKVHYATRERMPSMSEETLEEAVKIVIKTAIQK